MDNFGETAIDQDSLDKLIDAGKEKGYLTYGEANDLIVQEECGKCGCGQKDEQGDGGRLANELHEQLWLAGCDAVRLDDDERHPGYRERAARHQYHSETVHSADR